jgi:hypothetical protein
MPKTDVVKAVDTNPEIETPADPKIETSAARDPFDDLNSLRLDQSFAEAVGVRKLLRTIPVGKPKPQDFIRVHPDPAYRGNFPIIELQSEREIYLVTKVAAPELVGEFVGATLYTAINRQGIVRIWPVKLPGPDGKTNEWHRSAAEAAELAMQGWIRVKANMDLGAYEMFAAEGTMQEPEWPGLLFHELLRIAFRDRYVDSADHPIVKRLRGA